MRATSLSLVVLLFILPTAIFGSLKNDIETLKKSSSLSLHAIDSVHNEIRTSNTNKKDSLLNESYYLYAKYYFLKEQLDSTTYYLKSGRKFLDLKSHATPKYFEFLGTTLYYQRKVSEALPYYDSTIYFARELQDIELLIKMLNRSAVLNSELGQRENEIQNLREAKILADSFSLTQEQAISRVNLAVALNESKFTIAAIHNLKEAKHFVDSFEDPELKNQYLTYIYSNIGDFYGGVNQHDSAIYYGVLALELVSDQDTQMRSHISNSLGISYADLEDYDKANEYLESSFTTALELGHPIAILSSGSAYSNVLIHKEEFLRAKQVIFQALNAQNEVAFYDGLVGLHYNLGRVYMTLDMKDSAEFAFTKALDFKDSSRSQYLDESMARLKVEYDLDKNELERSWLQEQNELKDGVIQSSRIIVALSIITLVLFGGLLIVINRNRRSLKKKQLELQLKNEALRDSNQNNQRILSLIAHDVRGPLASLETLIKFHQKEENYSAFETLTIVKGSISTLNSLVSSLLNWARKEKGLSQFEPSLIPLRTELSKIKELYTHQLTFKQIEFDLSIPHHVMIYADENMLHTVLRNIVTNAIKFTSKDGQITVSHSIKDNYDEICIADNGIGISEENLRLMREGQITSQKGTNSELGTGLGVLLVRDMMTAHGGKLTIHSKSGEGSTFCLQFPKSTEAFSGSKAKIEATTKI